MRRINYTRRFEVSQATDPRKRALVGLGLAAVSLLTFYLWINAPERDPIPASREKGNVIRSRKAGGRKIVLPLRENTAIHELAFSKKGQLLAVVGCSSSALEKNLNLLQVWDVEKAAVIHEWKNFRVEGRLAIDLERLTIAISSAGELVHWNALTGRQLWKAAPHQAANDIAFSPDGKPIATAGPYGLRDKLAVIELWDARSGKDTFSHSPGIRSCDCVAFSPDGARLAVGGIDGDSGIHHLYVLDTNGRVLLERHDDHGGTTSIAFSRDGRTIATGGSSVCLWDADKGAKLADIERMPASTVHEGIFGQLFPILHPDGNTVVLIEDRVEQEIEVNVDDLVRRFEMGGRKGFQSGIDEAIAKMAASPGRAFTELAIWDRKLGREVDRMLLDLERPISPPHEAASALSEDGGRVACARNDTVHIVALKEELR